MTVTTATARVVHNGNGTTTQFAVPFRFLENAHVAVFLRDAAGGQVQWVENTQYTLTGADDAAGGTLTVITSPTDHTPAANEKLFVIRAVPITQETDYVENDPFPAETHERALDKLTMVNQEQTERLDRTFTIPEADSFAGSFELPIDTDRADMFLAFDLDGGPMVAAGTSANLGPVSAFIDTLLDDVDSVAARTTLGAQASLVPGTAGTALTSDGTDLVWLPPLPAGSTQLYVGSTAPAGWLLLEGDTIGNAASGGSARANADTEALFTLLYDGMADGQAPVSGGRGASAAADFAANKTITLPDMRGRGPIGTGTGAGLTARTHGDSDGEETHVLTEGEMPAHAHDLLGSTSASGGAQIAMYNSNTLRNNPTQSAGNDEAHNNMQPWLALRFIIKL